MGLSETNFVAFDEDSSCWLGFVISLFSIDWAVELGERLLCFFVMIFSDSFVLLETSSFGWTSFSTLMLDFFFLAVDCSLFFEHEFLEVGEELPVLGLFFLK